MGPSFKVNIGDSCLWHDTSYGWYLDINELMPNFYERVVDAPLDAYQYSSITSKLKSHLC